jgi:pyridoxamine 5'-phosphate oxidase
MSSTTPSASALPPAPWKKAFSEHISKMKSPEFVLGTLDSAPKGSPTPYVPRVRYCIHRGFWAELPENKHNDAERNPEVYQSDCPTFTTDVRMEKVRQIFATSAGHAESSDQVQGSGGGGAIEAVYWITETGTQWRIKGRAFVIADDIEGAEESSGVRTVKSELGKRMRTVDEGKEGEFSWQRELTGFFGNQSPGIKGMIFYTVVRCSHTNCTSQVRSRTHLLANPLPSPTMIRTSHSARRQTISTTLLHARIGVS